MRRRRRRSALVSGSDTVRHDGGDVDTGGVRRSLAVNGALNGLQIRLQVESRCECSHIYIVHRMMNSEIGSR